MQKVLQVVKRVVFSHHLLNPLANNADDKLRIYLLVLLSAFR